jgi:NADPH:quinone reductase-like Zn-dependent oxidoreductase
MLTRTLPQLARRRGSRFAHAAVCHKLGAPLEYGEWPLKALGPKQVRVKVAAAGVNFADILQARATLSVMQARSPQRLVCSAGAR